MERVYTQVERLSCTFMGEGWNCTFRAVPGNGAPEEAPGTLDRAAIDVSGVYISAEGEVGIDSYEEGSDVFPNAEIGFEEDEGVCLHEPDRGRLRCGVPGDFDELDRHYIESRQ